MSVGTELEKLNQLRKEGVLSEAEFTAAKSKILGSLDSENTVGSGVHLMGKAAYKYVNFKIVSAIFGLIIFAIFFFTFFMPRFLKMEAESEQFSQQHREKMEQMSKDFDKSYEETSRRIEQTRKEIDEAHRKSGFK
jgi:flagellar biosynthesis/type III secretory pathway M-ring protein FliF/YscJ